jgi:hypothetical protein
MLALPNDLFLSIVVIAAVVIFGALISVGNERQRKAIDKLHVAYKQWAIQDLRLKRGTAASQIQINDLQGWLTKATTLGFGHKTTVMGIQKHESPIATLEMHDSETGKTLVCVIETPDTVVNLLKRRKSVIRGDLRSNPLFRVGKKTPVVELSMLNAGSLFDVELPVAWKMLTGDVTESGSLWAYMLD